MVKVYDGRHGLAANVVLISLMNNSHRTPHFSTKAYSGSNFPPVHQYLSPFQHRTRTIQAMHTVNHTVQERYRRRVERLLQPNQIFVVETGFCGYGGGLGMMEMRERC